MTKFADEEEKLLAFLRQYRPISPPVAPKFEEELIELVHRHPLPRHQQRLVWAVPSAIAASLLLAWGGYRWFNPSTQIAINPDELEAFLVDNWDSTTGQATLASQSEKIDTDWLLLTESDIETRKHLEAGTR